LAWGDAFGNADGPKKYLNISPKKHLDHNDFDINVSLKQMR
jgi:hypothetical protein